MIYIYSWVVFINFIVELIEEKAIDKKSEEEDPMGQAKDAKKNEAVSLDKEETIDKKLCNSRSCHILELWASHDLETEVAMITNT